MLRFGHISTIDASKGLYKVTFEEDDLVSGWLPYLVKNTKQNKDESPFDQDEHVACLMDENCEYGVILGAINSETDLPIVGDKDIRVTTYKDGSYIKFDRATKKLTVSCEGDVEVVKATNINFKASSKITLDSDVDVTGKITVTKDIKSTTGNITSDTGDIKATLGDVKATTHSLSTHVHSGVTSGFSSTGPPTP